MKLFLILLCACAALTSASTLKGDNHAKEKRFLASVAHFFSHAYETVKNGVETAAHSVAGVAQTAAHAVAGAAETAYNSVKGAANTLIGDVKDVAHKVEGAVSHATEKLDEWTSEAQHLLAPVLHKMASTVGPIAKEVVDAAVKELKEQAPDMLKALGEIGLHELATTVITSAIGKRAVNTEIDALKELFAHLVQTRVNETVLDVHTVLNAVDKFNAEVQQEVAKFEHVLESGHNTEQAAKQFYLNVVAKIQPLIDAKAFDMDVSRFDKIVPDAINHFHKLLKGALAHSLSRRGVLLDVAQDVFGLVQQGEQHIGRLVSKVEDLAKGLLAPTVDNVKRIAQTLLDNAGKVTSSLMLKAMTLLAPFQQQLGPLFQQVQTLAGKFGLIG